MVFLSRITLSNIKSASKRSFIDSLRLHVRGGAGGNGQPKYGGLGGKGGDVYVIAKEGIKLNDIQKKHTTKRIAAGYGGHSEKRKLLGEPGSNVHIEAPVGITVFDEFGRLLGDLDAVGSEVLVARGGAGGSSITHFTGLAGQSGTIVLDLKLIADVGLVGFPNAGKSSLLKAISKAKPKIASYPFTTIEPNVGVLKFNDYREITMADLPGLIEGAHANIGMGHKFLKHIERTKLILMVIDINGFRLSPKHQHRSAFETLVLLNKELELYREDILRKPILLAINKMDTQGAQIKWYELAERLKSFRGVIEDLPEEMRPIEPLEIQDIVNISVTSCNQSVLELKQKIRDILDTSAEMSSNDEELNLRNQLKLKMMESGPKMI